MEADTAALALAGFAVFLGASVAAVLVFRPLSRRSLPEPPEPSEPTPPESEPSVTTAAPAPSSNEPHPGARPTSSISVTIAADEDGCHRWRVTVPTTGDRTTVDVFSFRPLSGGAESPWQHELLAAPLRVAPGHGASVGTPIDPDLDYAVSVGWTSHRGTGDRHTSELLRIPARRR